MPDLPSTLPIDADAEAALQMIMTLLRERLLFKKPAKSEDIEVFERSIRSYGDLRVKEEMEGRSAGRSPS